MNDPILSTIPDKAQFHVLSLDLDFFVEPIAWDEEPGSVRLSSADYKVDGMPLVLDVLDQRCHLSEAAPVRGLHVRDHDSAYDVIELLVRECGGPLVLHHVDAHADLGMGDPGWKYLLQEWLWLPPPRQRPRELTLGNWLPFAAANGWLRSIEFALRLPSRSDFPEHFCGSRFPPERLTFTAQGSAPSSAESPRPIVVPVRLVPEKQPILVQPPDFVIVCQSPNFTPLEIDALLPWTRRRILEDCLGRTWPPLWTPD